MNDKLQTLKEKVDDIGYGIYMAEVIAWDRLTDKVGMSANLATVIDVLAIAAGLYSVIRFTGGIRLLGILVILLSVGSIYRRVLA